MAYKYVYQHNTNDCAVACLLSIIRYYKGNNTYENIHYLTHCDNNGVTALNLINASNKLGFESRGLKVEYAHLKNLKIPIIAHLILKDGYNHYVVVEKIKENTIYIFDPAKGKIKYKKEEAEISFCARCEKNEILLEIRDNGIGISPKDLPRITDKGYTGTTGRNYEKSTGMGLYLCKKLCDKLQLSFKIESKEEEYTIVTIGFPRSSMIFLNEE